MKNDDFRSPFGVTILDVSVIFIKFQGGFRPIMVIWSGRFGRAPVMVLVIFKVARSCGGKGVNKERRKWVIAQDLTRPGPRPGEFRNKAFNF